MKKITILLVSAGLMVALSACKTSPDTKKNSEFTQVSASDLNAEFISYDNINSPESGKTIMLTKADFLEKVMNYEENPNTWVFKGDKPCLIDFYADWCGPCRMAAPVLEELAAEYAGQINIYKIDTQTERELSSVFGIRSLPSFLYCPKEGNPQMASGIGRTPAETKENFKNMIEQILLSNQL